MPKARITKRCLQPRQYLETEIIMLCILEKVPTDGEFAILGHAGTWHVDHADAAKIVTDEGDIIRSIGGTRYQSRRAQGERQNKGPIPGAIGCPCPHVSAFIQSLSLSLPFI